MSLVFQNAAEPYTDGFAPSRLVLTGQRTVFMGRAHGIAAFRSAVPMVVLPLEGAGRPSVIGAASMGRVPPGGAVLLYFSDPLRDELSTVGSGGTDELHALARTGPAEDPALFVEQLRRALGITDRSAPHPAVARAADAIGRAPDEFATLSDAATLSGLSPDRFRKLFKRDTGLTFSRYRQWRRMGAVVRSVARGDSLTAAAHGAGFASSAHLSSAFRDMFGMSPSQLIATGAALHLETP